MYIKSISHHDGDLPEKIKDLSMGHFVFYEIFLYYLGKNKGTLNLDSDEYLKVCLLIKKKTRVESVEIFIKELASIGAWNYNENKKTVTSPSLVQISKKFAEGGAITAQIRKRKAELLNPETKDQSLEIEQKEVQAIISKSNLATIGNYKSNSDLVNKLMEFNFQGNHNSFRSILDYEKLVTKINPETIEFYLNSIELFKKASQEDNGKLPAFRNGYFRIFNEFKKAIDAGIDLKPELPEWVKIANPNEVKEIQESQFNYKEYTFYSPPNGEFSWISFLNSFLATKMKMPDGVKKFCEKHSKEEWKAKLDSWFLVDNTAKVKDIFIQDLRVNFNVDEMFESYQYYKEKGKI